MVTRIDLHASDGGRGGSLDPTAPDAPDAPDADALAVRLGRLTDADQDFVSAHLAGLRRSLSLLTRSDLLRISCGRTETGLVLSSQISTDRPCEVHLTVQRAGIQLSISDSHSNRQKFLRRLLAGQGVVWERLAREGTPLLGLLPGTGKVHRLRRLDAIGALLPFLVGLDQALRQFRGLLPDREAMSLLLECAGAGIGHQSWLVRGGRKLVAEALEPLLFSRRHSLAAVLGAPARSVFWKQVLRIAQTADRDQQPDATVLDQIRDALRNALRPTPTSARDALVEWTELLSEELVEVGILLTMVEQQDRGGLVSQGARFDRLANRAGLVGRRMRRGLDLADSACLSMVASLLDSAHNALHELKRLLTREGSAQEKTGSGPAASRLIESALCAVQILSRISLCLRDRSPRSHEEIGRLVDGFVEIDRAVREIGPRVKPRELRESLLALCARLSHCGEELFEASLQSMLRGEQPPA